MVAVAVRARHAAAVSDGLALGHRRASSASRSPAASGGATSAPARRLRSSRSRRGLHYPVNYWNGLAILAGMALPLLLRAARRRSGRAILRALALAPVPGDRRDDLPDLVARRRRRGGRAACSCSARSRRAARARWSRPRSASVGAIAAVEVLLARDDLVNGPLSAPAVAGQGQSAALLIALLGGGLRRRSTGPGAGSPTGTCGCRAPAQAALVGAGRWSRCAGVAAFDPAGKFEDFKRPPGETKYTEGDFTRSHLLSSTSTGRWQLWAAAGDQWETKPALGQGAGSYQSWWTEHADFPLFVRDAHNLWLEMLGELGIVGFAADRARVRHRLRGGAARGCGGPGPRGRWWRRSRACWRHSCWAPRSTGCGS